MRADVRQTVELALDVEDPDLTPPYLHYPVRTLREVREVAHNVLLAPLLRHGLRLRRLPLASMLNSLRAFFPKTLRRTSLVNGTW